MVNIEKLKSDIQALRFNPAGIQRLSLDTLAQVHQHEIDVVDATNPFIFLLMSSSVHASAAMTENVNLTRQQYPSMALTEDELYLHMSDQDFIGRFATPARTSFSLLLNKEEAIKRAVATNEGGVRKLTIPRHSEFLVGDYTFTLQYPIDIRVMGHGGLQVVYDVSEPSPLQTIDTNLLEWDIVTLQQNDYVRIEVPIHQFTLASHLVQLNQATAYRRTFSLSDPFYYCRVWRARGNGAWEEIRTTHTDQVFDPQVPTVLLKVYEGRLQVSVPHVYISQGILKDELRVDIYTTKGPLDLMLENYPANAFSVRWRDLTKGRLDRFSTPLTVFSGMTVFSDAVVTGGTPSLSFTELRERVLMNAIGPAQLPITANQMASQLRNRGYSPILDVDNITSRIFLASRQLTAPDDLQSPIGSVFGRLQASFDTLSRFPGVIENGRRLTITPEALMRLDNGLLSLVEQQEREHIDSLGGELFTSQINNNSYLYTPFHYVLDSSGPYFVSRPYYLEAPKVDSRQFIEENQSLGMALSTRSVKVEKRDNGYRVVVVTQSGETVKGLRDDSIRFQIGVRPQGQNQDVFLLGEFQGRTKDQERIYHFDIDTQWDVTENHALVVTNLRATDGEIRRSAIELTSALSLVYYVAPEVPSHDYRYSLAYRDGRFQVDASFYGIVHERITVAFGQYLEGFWTNDRSVMDSVTYETYQEDVLAYYEETVYKRDVESGHLDISLDENGKVTYTILHQKGDPVLDSEGNHVTRHRKGDVKVDVDQNPIVLSRRDVLREIDMFLLDGRYFFVTDPATVAYVNTIPRQITTWLLDDVREFRQWALEQTDIYLYPRQTLGSVTARVRENEELLVDLEQTFTVTFYLNRERYQDSYMRGVLSTLTQDVLSKSLLERRVTVNGIVRELTERTSEDVIALTVTGLGGSEELSAITLESDTDRCVIRKRLTRTLDGELTVENDINVLFIRHEDQ